MDERIIEWMSLLCDSAQNVAQFELISMHVELLSSQMYFKQKINRQLMTYSSNYPLFELHLTRHKSDV
jgi:hypothetical protein